MKLLIVLILILARLCVFSQPLPPLVSDTTPQIINVPKQLTNSVEITWTDSNPEGTNKSFAVWCGTQSGVYLTNWTCSGTNITIPVAWLFPGTNYLAVSTRIVWSDQSLAMSNPSAEVTIIRLQSFPIWIKVGIQSKTNLTSEWGTEKNFYLFSVVDPKASEFFRSNIKIEVVEQDALVLNF